MEEEKEGGTAPQVSGYIHVIHLKSTPAAVTFELLSVCEEVVL